MKIEYILGLAAAGALALLFLSPPSVGMKKAAAHVEYVYDGRTEICFAVTEARHPSPVPCTDAVKKIATPVKR